MKLVFIDTETTGLDPERHHIWEVAAIVREDGKADEEFRRMMLTDLTTADPAALRLGRYYERIRTEDRSYRGVVAVDLAEVLDGATLVGANPSFDAAFLGRFLRDFELCPTWNYRLVDVEVMAMTRLGWPIPKGLGASARALGLDSDAYETHTALGDARLARDVYDRVLTGGS